MASTFVSYKGQDVRVPESTLVCLGHMIFHEAWSRAQNENERARIEQMIRDFELRTIGVGCADLGLDQILNGNPQKEADFLSFVSVVRDRLHSFGEMIPAEYVDEVISVHIPSYRGQSLGSPWFPRVLDVIEGVVRGERIPPLSLYEGPDRVIVKRKVVGDDENPSQSIH